MKNKKEILIGKIAEICLRNPNGITEDPEDKTKRKEERRYV